MARSTTRRQSPGRDTSASTATQRRPLSWTARRVSCSRSARRAQIATSAPASANPVANATPRPDEAPVTTTTLPSSVKRLRMLGTPCLLSAGR